MVDFLKEWKKYFTFAALLSCFVNILQLTFPFYMFTIYSNVVISYSEVSLVNITTAAFFAVTILGLFSYLRSRLLAVAGKKLTVQIRERVFAGMLKASVINNQNAYRGGNDLEILQNYCSSPGIYALFDAPWSPFYLVLIYMFHPVLGWIATAGALVMVALSGLQEFLVGKSMVQANLEAGRNLQFVDSFLRNVEVINGMGMVPAVSNRFIRKNNRVMAHQTQSSYHAGSIQAVIKPLQNVIQVCIYCAGAWYAMTEGMDVGLMVAASIIMGRALAPLMQVMSSWRLATQAKQAYSRLKRFTESLDRQSSTMPLPRPKGRIHAVHAGCRIGRQTLVNDISFKLDPGEFLGIIGHSGAGKTTLCRLLLGAWPSSVGKIYLDGQDIFLWKKEEVGPYMGYLPQEIELFPGSVADNIARLGGPDPDEIEKALDLSGIKEMVESFPQGLETLLEGENGIRLSGGQKQKIGLARALYKQPAFLVLDEPTSNLDEQGEQQLLHTLAAMKMNKVCTCIMVTHKPSLLQSMDKILVLQNGNLAMFGPKDQVFAKLRGGL